MGTNANNGNPTCRLAPTHLLGPPHCLPTAQVRLEPGRRSTTRLAVVIADLEIQYCIRPKPSLARRTIMSDKEMNIDEGTFVDPFPFTPGHLILSLKWPKVARPKKWWSWFSEFSRFVASPYVVLYVLILMPMSSPSAGNEVGVGPEQTYDRVESAPARDVDPERHDVASSLFIIYVSGYDAYLSCVYIGGRKMERSRHQHPPGGDRGGCY
jgi:hypothetical protein